MNFYKIILLVALLTFGQGYAYASMFDPATKFSNTGSIANTRHNLTQLPISGGGPDPSWMNYVRNNYAEVCVYCHTPHGSNTTVSVPLWNHTIKATTYTTYDQLGTTSLMQTVSQPNAASLVCLSCPDGTTAIDSIINMPGSGFYNATQTAVQDNTFLDTWPLTAWTGDTSMGRHSKLGEPGCMSCHKQGFGVAAAWFNAGLTGTDLRDDHPVGITYPSVNGPGTDFKTPSGISGTTRYFDIDGNGKMGKGDLRLYDTGGVVQVECGSCHDAHGVPSAGSGSVFQPTFMRMSNSGSALCLVCHDN